MSSKQGSTPRQNARWSYSNLDFENGLALLACWWRQQVSSKHSYLFTKAALYYISAALYLYVLNWPLRSRISSPEVVDSFLTWLSPHISYICISNSYTHLWNLILYITLFVLFIPNSVARDSSNGIAFRYGLDGPEIESRWGRGFSQPSRPALGPTQPPIQ
jgi:hypothetical protein